MGSDKIPKMPSELQTYIESLTGMLRQIYPRISILTEWATMSDEDNMYSPRVDIAVGPFATNHQSFISEYDQLMDSSRQFIDRLLAAHNLNINASEDSVFTSFNQLKFKNQNARCLLIIEIENKVSRKHLMGGAINAAALGRIGIAVAWTPDKLRAFIKLRRYLQFLGSVGKNTFDTTNLLILDRDQLLHACQDDRLYSCNRYASAGQWR